MAIRPYLVSEKKLSERERRNLAILKAIKRLGPVSRTEISKVTGLNVVTVSNYINSYIAKRLVLEKGLDVSTGGRKPALVELNNKVSFVIGIDLGTTGSRKVKMIAILADLAMNIIAKVKRARPSEDMEKIISRSVGLVEEVIDEANVKRKNIRGICLGISGVIDERTGTIRDSVPGGRTASYETMRGIIESKFGIPTIIANDATVAAFGEREAGLGRDVENMLYMYSDRGCGIIINGEIYKGVSGSAGELGLKTEAEFEDFPWTKDYLFLTPGAIVINIPKQARKAIESGVKSKISELVGGKLDDITMEELVGASKDEDKLAMELIEHAGINMGIRIASLVNLFNPEMVVIGGGLEEAGALLFDSLRRAVRRYAFEEPASAVNIVPARHGKDFVAIGAASIVVREVFAQA